MSTLDYGPVLDGAPYDPQPEGGAVTTLGLYANVERTGSPTTFGPATRVSAGVYRFAIPDSQTAGRYWARVTWTAETGGTPILDDLSDPVDLPVRDDLAVSPEALAVKLGIALPITAAQRQTITDVILDAQADVEAYLGRPILPRIYTERRTWPPGYGWEANEQPLLEVLSELEVLDENDDATGYWDITYLAGLDARSEPRLRPIRRLLLAHAAQQDDAVRLWATVGSGAADDGSGRRRVKSLAAEGQSVSYEFGVPGGGDVPPGPGSEPVGGPVRWASIDRWRLRGRRVFQRGSATGGLTHLSSRP